MLKLKHYGIILANAKRRRLRETQIQETREVDTLMKQLHGVKILQVSSLQSSPSSMAYDGRYTVGTKNYVVQTNEIIKKKMLILCSKNVLTMHKKGWRISWMKKKEAIIILSLWTLGGTLKSFRELKRCLENSSNWRSNDLATHSRLKTLDMKCIDRVGDDRWSKDSHPENRMKRVPAEMTWSWSHSNS